MIAISPILTKVNLLLGGLFIVLLLTLALSRIFFPVDLGFYESVIWTPADIAIHGGNPYDYALKEPYVMAPYGYFYYLLTGIGNYFFGHHFWFARSLSVIAAIICCFCLTRICRLFSDDYTVVIISIVFFLSSVASLQLWAMQRPDLIALASGSIGLLLVINNKSLEKRYSQSDLSNFKAIAAALLCCGALFFKQTFILPTIISALWVSTKYKLKSLLLFGITGLILAFSLILLLNDMPDKGYVWQHFVLTTQIPVNYENWLRVTTAIIFDPFTIIVFSTIPIIFVKGLRVLLEKNYIYFLLYFISAMLIALFTSSRAGSNANYYLEFDFAASILIVIAVSRLETKRLRSGILLLLLVCSIFNLSRSLRGEYFRWQSYPYYSEIMETYNQNVSEQGIGISVYPDLIALNDKKYHFGDWIQYIDGRSPELESAIEEAFASRRYEAIIWNVPNDPMLTDKYQMIEMKTPVPSKGLHPIYLYILKK